MKKIPLPTLSIMSTLALICATEAATVVTNLDNSLLAEAGGSYNDSQGVDQSGATQNTQTISYSDGNGNSVSLQLQVSVSVPSGPFDVNQTIAFQSYGGQLAFQGKGSSFGRNYGFDNRQWNDGQNVTISVTNIQSTGDVDMSSLEFRIDSIDIYNHTNGGKNGGVIDTGTLKYDSTASGTANAIAEMATNGGQKYTTSIDTNFADLDDGGYSMQLYFDAADSSDAEMVYRLGDLSSTLNFQTTASVPEPSTVSLLGLAGLALVIRKRR